VKPVQLFSVAASAVVGVSVANADVILSDTEFAPSNWGLETSVISPGGTSTAAQTTGGNPGFGRQMTNTLNAGGVVFGFSRYGTSVATRYEPALQGAITSVDYSIDARWISGLGGQGHSIMLGAKQGQVVYFADPEVTGSSGFWTSHGAAGLVASDFAPLVSGAPIDFSATGAPLRFGFIVGNSGSTNYSNVVIYDNFSTTIHNIPAPTCVAVSGVFGLALRRRR